MSGAVVALMAEDGCYELLCEGEIAARLVWVECPTFEHEALGWWLDVPGRAAEPIYLVPSRLASDLPRARQSSVETSLILAEQLLAE